MTISRIERRWTHAILDAIYPRGSGSGDRAGLATGILDLDVDGYLDELPRAWPAISWIAFRFAVVLVALAPLFLGVAFRPFDRLTREQKLRVLGRLGASNLYPVRQLLVLIKAVGGILYGAAPRVRTALTGAPRVTAGPALVELRRREA